MSDIASQLDTVRERIAQAASAAHRPASSVALMAVSKTFPAEAVREAYEHGQTIFGESYLQEALQKLDSLTDIRTATTWHFIGPVQSNKTRPIAERFDWVHSVDRLKIAERLSAQRPEALGPLNICIQVNTSGESTKSGLAADEVRSVAKSIAMLPHLTLRGLMAIPEPADTIEAQRVPHRALRELFEQLRADGHALDTLSMGMSSDLEAAVLEGATIVRIGTAIFGVRDYAAH
ncbi:Pyridoxal phosphate homeostasis protein [Pararobbsia alpina]|uniref:YggS family pyridoxal phosphate-dependent enzyme n=1 Tax=Pararobbsia alpina TaxID=621374 RepID=UPI0039A6A511